MLGKTGQNNLARATVDEAADRLIRFSAARQWAWRLFPRVSWDEGITKLTFLACHEWVGVLFVVTLVGICGNQRERKAALCRGLKGRTRESTIVDERLLFIQIQLMFEA